jgi:hypothetical protein
MHSVRERTEITAPRIIVTQSARVRCIHYTRPCKSATNTILNVISLILFRQSPSLASMSGMFLSAEFKGGLWEILDIPAMLR